MWSTVWLWNRFAWTSEVRNFGKAVGVGAEETVIIAKPRHTCWSRRMWARKEPEQKRGTVGNILTQWKSTWVLETESGHGRGEDLLWDLGATWAEDEDVPFSVRDVPWQHGANWACQPAGRKLEMVLWATGWREPGHKRLVSWTDSSVFSWDGSVCSIPSPRACSAS